MSPKRLLWFLLAAALLNACTGLGPPTELPSRTFNAQATEPRRQVPAEVLNADVYQDTIQQTICQPGYAASVRPSTTYTNAIKARLLREQGLPRSATVDYELDHVIPLNLGGHPRALGNLALQPWAGDDGAHRKDLLERRLQLMVCAGQLPLIEARTSIYFDWREAFRRYMPPRDNAIGR